MTSNSLARCVLPVVSLLLFSSAVWFGSPELEIETVPVAGSVSMLVGNGGNIGLQVGPSGVLMVDDQFAADAPNIQAAINSLAAGADDGDVAPAFLINTHFHGDHTGSNPTFGKASTIVAHRNVRVRLVGEDQPAVALPVVTYDDGLSIHFNGEEVRLIHMPGAHTDGDTVVWFTGSGVIHLGDLYFQNGYPYIDIGAGGSAAGIIAAIESVLAKVPAETKVIPGHGVTTDLAGLREYLEMLATIRGRVAELYAESFTLDEILEAGVTEDYDERWAGGFINSRQFVRSVIGDPWADR